jgi:catechol 2,3-dioxygenase-like lactoylglutathione lyase family enzyme
VTPFAVRTVDHVAVSAPKELEGEVVDWYERVLGLERLAKPEGTRSAGAWFRAGEVQIHITIERDLTLGSGHFGVAVHDLDDAVERLRSSGSTIKDAKPIPGRRRFYANDPAGNTIEIVCYDEERSA